MWPVCGPSDVCITEARGRGGVGNPRGLREHDVAGPGSAQGRGSPRRVRARGRPSHPHCPGRGSTHFLRRRLVFMHGACKCGPAHGACRLEVRVVAQGSGRYGVVEGGDGSAKTHDRRGYIAAGAGSFGEMRCGAGQAPGSTPGGGTHMARGLASLSCPLARGTVSPRGFPPPPPPSGFRDAHMTNL